MRFGVQVKYTRVFDAWGKNFSNYIKRLQNRPLNAVSRDFGVVIIFGTHFRERFF